MTSRAPVKAEILPLENWMSPSAISRKLTLPAKVFSIMESLFNNVRHRNRSRSDRTRFFGEDDYIDAHIEIGDQLRNSDLSGRRSGPSGWWHNGGAIRCRVSVQVQGPI